MVAVDSSVIGTVKAVAHIAKYNNGRTPADGEPDETVEVTGYFERSGDGLIEITDPERIAAIEARQQEGANHAADERGA